MKVQYKKTKKQTQTPQDMKKERKNTEPISEAVKNDWTDDSSEEQGVEECLFNKALNLEAKRLAMLEFPQIPSTTGEAEEGPELLRYLTRNYPYVSLQMIGQLEYVG